MFEQQFIITKDQLRTILLALSNNPSPDAPVNAINTVINILLNQENTENSEKRSAMHYPTN